MHVHGTGAVRLYIQLAPWRYSTDHFGVEFRFSLDTNITLATAMEQVPPPLQMYTQATGELQLQASQRNYVS